MNIILESPLVHADVSSRQYEKNPAFEPEPSSEETNDLVCSEVTSAKLDNQQSPMNHLLVVDGPCSGGRRRADSTGDALERLTLFEENRRESSEKGVSPPPLRTGPATPSGVSKRLWSLQPDTQAVRDISHIATPTRPKMQRGKTIDTATVHRTEEEDDMYVNQYKVLDIIGHGSFGIVRKVTSENETFAMKIIGKKRSAKKRLPFRGRGPMKPPPDPMDDIRREIAILKKLDHPNVVKLFEVLDDPQEDDLILVFEFISSGAVMEKISPEYRMSEDKARRYFIDLFLGLEYLHEQKVIHRDIKPENLLLDSSNTLKIADFGVSEHWDSNTSDVELHKSAGTPAFTAPETLDASNPVFGGKPLDLWAAGVTLYCFVFGKVPFKAPSRYELYERIREEEVHFPEDVPISAELRDLLTKLLEKDPAKRITTSQIRDHPWITVSSQRIPSVAENCQVKIDITDKDIDEAVKRYNTPIHILVMIKNMAKRKSLRHPYANSGMLSPQHSPAVVHSPSITVQDLDESPQGRKRTSFATTRMPTISVDDADSASDSTSSM